MGPGLRRDDELEACSALVTSELTEPIGPARTGLHLGGAQEAEPDQGVVQFVGVYGVGPGFALDPRNCLRIEAAELSGDFRRPPGPAHHRLGAAALQRML